jgi:tripartite-type tricarboxylate transporter receptor subunit TctC
MTIDIERRKLLAGLGGAMALWPPGALAQVWPQRLVRIVVPYAPGGGTDAFARILAAGLSKSSGYQIIVENKSGGSTNVGTEAVARAAADGYTILFGSPAFAINRFLFPTLAYDALKDFAPVSLLASFPDIMAVPNTSPAKTVSEFIAYAKSNGGRTTFTSSGVGSSPHLAGELFKRRAGIDMTHIPYRGSNPAATDTIAGRVDVFFDTFASALPLVRGGQLRGLAVTSAKRSPAARELPSIAEAALPDFDVSGWYALYVPAKTPPEIIRKLNTDVVTALGDPEFHNRLDQLGVVVIGSTPEQLDRHLKTEFELWEPVIKAANIKVE